MPQPFNLLYGTRHCLLLTQACLWTPAELSGWLDKKGKTLDVVLCQVTVIKRCVFPICRDWLQQMEQAIFHSEGRLDQCRPLDLNATFAYVLSCSTCDCLMNRLFKQGSGLFYFSDIKASTAKGVIPIELAKVEAARDKTEKKRFLIKVWVAAAYTDISKHRKYILSSPSSQVQVTTVFNLLACCASVFWLAVS